MTPLEIVGYAFLVASAIGLVVYTFEVGLSWWYVRRPRPTPRAERGISILKPLCGIDDGLAENLRQFAELDYGRYELLLGVPSEDDPAYPIAEEACRRWPDRVRLVVQQRAPGLNPKINQLIALADEATYDILLISDSNVRAPDGYLDEIAARFEDPEVALVTNPISGLGEQRFGAALDNYQLAASVACGVLAAKVGAGQDIVVGKSLAIRRSDLGALGGFHALRNHLAEDQMLGNWVSKRLRKRIELCQLPVYSYCSRRSVRGFVARHQRWGVIQWTVIPPWVYLAQGLRNPLFLGFLGVLLVPSAAPAWVLACGLKLALDVAAIRLFRPRAFGWQTPLIMGVRDLLIAYTWTYGIFSNMVAWRGTTLHVGTGSTLIAPTEPPTAWPSRKGPAPDEESSVASSARSPARSVTA